MIGWYRESKMRCCNLWARCVRRVNRVPMAAESELNSCTFGFFEFRAIQEEERRRRRSPLQLQKRKGSLL